jgi:UDP-N-acetylglucosamine--N-acetylmuramyl-(pentapeptide) pyrophosphoryl-undecaprenol N-acetylglucosamine transferase
MKIVFTGGGTGGHFYPIIAVAEALRERCEAQKRLPPVMYYFAPTQYNPRALFDNDIAFVAIPAGKIRRYFSLLNITDLFKTAYGIVRALRELYKVFPDVVFSKGAYASFPTVLAARLLRIPVIIHESDSKPGTVNAWAGKFAAKIAISYPDAVKYFPHKDKVAFTGNPIRREIAIPHESGSHEFFGLDAKIPTLLVLGGSQGAQAINDLILEALPLLLDSYNVIHQTGAKNFALTKNTAQVILEKHPHASRYVPFAYLDELTLRNAAGIAKIIISRAGSTLFEIAAWGIPAIVIPLPTNISHDQTGNALAYQRAGAGIMLEEINMSDAILVHEIKNIIDNPARHTAMAAAAKAFAKEGSADIIAQGIIDIAVAHENK